MVFDNLLVPERVCIDSASQSKTAVLLKVSQILCQNQPELDIETIFDAFWRRDSLGSTAIGHGIMIPHIRTSVLSHTKVCFIKLEYPVDFGAEDKQPVDLVFGLIVPQEHPDEHLQTLKSIIQQFNQCEFRKACRQANNSQALYQLLTQNTTIAENDYSQAEV